MIVGPNEAKKLTKEQEKVYSDLVNSIDSFLINNYTGDTIAYELEHPVGIKIQVAIQNNYVQAGWDEIDFTEDKHSQKPIIIFKPEE